MRTYLALGLLVLLSFSSAFSKGKKDAKKADDVPTFKTHSSCILVPTVVVDKNGAPITGLRQNDFVISEDNVHQEVKIFEERHTQPANVRSVQGANDFYYNHSPGEVKEQRLTMIVFDTLNTRFTDQARGRRELLKFLEQTLSPDEPVALASIGPKGLNMINDFTTDPKALIAAVKEIRGQQARADRSDTTQQIGELVQQNQRELESKLRTAAEVSRQQGINRTSPLDDRLHSFTETTMDAFEQMDAFHDLELTLISMKQIGEYFSGMPGRKTVIWVTGGIPIVTEEIGFFRGNRQVYDLYDATWDALSRSQVSIYPLDMGGLFAPGMVSARFSTSYRFFSSMADSVYNLENFANMTGGKLCIHKMSVSSCYEAAQQDAVHYYLLGYYADPNQRKEGWRKIKVKVSAPNAVVRARSGYLLTPDAVVRSEREDTMLALLSPIDFTTIPLRVHLDPHAMGKSSRARLTMGKGASIQHDIMSVPFQFFVPGPAITVNRQDDNLIDLTLSAFAKDNKGDVKGEFSRSLSGHLKPEMLAAIEHDGIGFGGAMDLPPGKYNVRFIVRDNISKQLGSVSIEVDTNAQVAAK